MIKAIARKITENEISYLQLPFIVIAVEAIDNKAYLAATGIVILGGIFVGIVHTWANGDKP